MLFTRWVPALVIGSMVAFVTPGHGQDTPDPAARLTEILRELPAADSILVGQQSTARRPLPAHPVPRGERRPPAGRRADPVPPRAASERDPSAEVGRPSAGWAARFAHTLASGRLLDRPCLSSRTPGDTVSHLEAWVRAHYRDRIRHFQIRFDERCALISDKPFGVSLDISPVSQSLLDLVREALPGDSLFPKSVLPPRVPVPPVGRDPATVVAPPTAGELPEYGEYVYVEELPEAVERALPVMPQSAREAGVSGTVMVQALVGKDGLIKDTLVVKSIPMLDAAAIECVRAWRFKPALSLGQPVAVWVAVPVKFAAQ